MMTPMAASLIAPMASSFILPVVRFPPLLALLVMLKALRNVVSWAGRGYDKMNHMDKNV